MSNRSKYCIIGIPDHQGVINIGGRVGAARGPMAFRKIFFRFQGKLNPVKDVKDFGDVPNCGTDISLNHRLAADLIRDGQQASERSVVVGGGHDHGYSQLLGISEAFGGSSSKSKIKFGCINIDAHFDVRKPAPYITSGCPFYLALERGILEPKNFVEFGIQSHCNSLELWKYIEDKKIQVVPFQKLRLGKAIRKFREVLKKLAGRCDVVVLSVDLDAAASAYAPGVSAPQAEGFTSMELVEMAEIAAREKKIKSLGIFELNPEHDIDDRTARLAATVAYHFF